MRQQTNPPQHQPIRGSLAAAVFFHVSLRVSESFASCIYSSTYLGLSTLIVHSGRDRGFVHAMEN
ncbi:hypothetical protein AB4Z29_11730 [Paenibacillus sp. 2TAB23]|uniref:hypothetical protein n=1 Tax=Paenibacillus sp. 2TAB23 TaxID=3233004 RepID=UPI003F9C74AF